MPAWGCTCGPCQCGYTSKFKSYALPSCGGRYVMESTIDLKALLVEREDCDAGTVQQLRNALAQGGTQYKTLRDVTEALKKKLEAAAGTPSKRWHLKLGIASFFLGNL